MWYKNITTIYLISLKAHYRAWSLAQGSWSTLIGVSWRKPAWQAELDKESITGAQVCFENSLKFYLSSVICGFLCDQEIKLII